MVNRHSHDNDHHGHSHDHGHEHSHGDEHHQQQTKSCSKTVRLSTMLALIFGFFIVEIIVGHITHSLTLIADSFHMLSDFIALCIALFSVWISKRQSTINTFGWVRAEILGALINSVFLVSLCLSIVIEAIERFIHEHELHEIDLLLYVACGGLLINIFGLFIFGHGHSHGHVHTTEIKEFDSIENDDNVELDVVVINKQINSEDIEASKCLMNQQKVSGIEKNSLKKSDGCCKFFKLNHVDLNIRAVFLHVLADALGSVVVIISALLNKYHKALKINEKYIRYVDPVLCLILVFILLISTIPLLKEAAFILLQSVPKDIKIDVLKRNVKKINGVAEINTLHVWKLSDQKIVASAHISFNTINDYLLSVNKIKKIFHEYGILSTTIEPTFLNDKLDPGLSNEFHTDNELNNLNVADKVENNHVC